MGKKSLKLLSLFKTKESPPSKHHRWKLLPSCGQQKTLPFKAGDDIFKKVNTVFFDPDHEINTVETTPHESCFTTSSESASFSADSEHNYDGESLEMFLRGVRSERLFFEPGNTSSILENANKVGVFPFKESVLLAMESEDPYEDFKRSMEEMMETHGLKDWKCLEELLSVYLRVNGKNNHGFIVLAFVDLLLSLAEEDSRDSCSNHSTSYDSAVSSFASSPLYLSDGQNEIIDQHEDIIRS
ncbi:transcription repressor OFP13-like [Gastrolobium bilobum]|uniref:transcription repressor OFP13-like n=1 Tax=Gastrolobium bilobum TaxID=150636 RepID=UPI002AB1D814|nr:transcription repressor OFP13-like [Gastrolobium bilobum]